MKTKWLRSVIYVGIRILSSLDEAIPVKPFTLHWKNFNMEIVGDDLMNH